MSNFYIFYIFGVLYPIWMKLGEYMWGEGVITGMARKNPRTRKSSAAMYSDSLTGGAQNFYIFYIFGVFLSDLDETWRVYAGAITGCLFVCFPTPSRFLGRSLPNLVGWWRGTPEVSLRGYFSKSSRLMVNKGSNICSPKFLGPRSLIRFV